MTPRILAVALLAGCAWPLAAAQTSVQTTPPGTYAGDYEVGSWPVEARERPDTIRTSGLNSGGELLGGPIPQVERQKVETLDYGNVRVVMTEAAQQRLSGTERVLQPGARLESPDGIPLGRVAMVQRNPAGKINTAWVQPPNDNGADLRPLDVDSITLRDGKVIIDAG